jgi:O-antigen ligase
MYEPALNLKKLSKPIYFSVSLLVVAAPVGFLSVPHWINAALGLLTIVLLVDRTNSQPMHVASASQGRQTWLAVIGLSAPLMAVLFGQIFRGDWHWPDYDAPARTLFGAIVCVGLIRSPLLPPMKLAALLSAALTLTLMLLPVGISDEAIQHWGGRYATRLTDTTTYGSYVGLITTLTLALFIFYWVSARNKNNVTKTLTAILMTVSVTTGLWALIGSQTRGAWIAATVATGSLTWLFLTKSMTGAHHSTRLTNGRVLPLLAILALVVLTIVLADKGTIARLTSILHELLPAISGKYQPDSAGIRAQMYRAALDLFLSAPWTGYGDLNYNFILQAPEYTAKYNKEVLEMLAGAGPHSETFGRALQSGIWGFIATVVFLGIPIAIFLRNRKTDVTPPGQIVNNSGVVLMCYLIIVQFTTEFSLKHVSSFNAYLLAVMLAISIKSKNACTKDA